MSWPDRNDSFYLEQYRYGRQAKAVLAVCLSEAGETYHHWRVFTHGADGVCIQFRREMLLTAFKLGKNLLHGPVEYVELNKATAPSLERLPFLKRYPYRDEKEYRFVYVDLKRKAETKCFAIPLDCIEKIILSPWLPKNLTEAVSAAICSIDGCAGMKVSRTTLLENTRWKNLGKTSEAGWGFRRSRTLNPR